MRCAAVTAERPVSRGGAPQEPSGTPTKERAHTESGAPMRRVLRLTLIAGLTGTLMVGVAWAGIGLTPMLGASAPTSAVTATTATGAAPSAAVNAAGLSGAQLLVGAAKASMAPRPADMAARFPGARWET